MYAVSEQYLRSIAAHTVTVDWYGSIRCVNGVVYQITPSVIDEGSGKITRQICAGEDLDIGTTCAAQLDLTLRLPNVSRYELFNATVKLEFRLRLPDRSWETVPIGEFTITDPPERSLDLISITAYDNMMKFNRNFSATVQGTPYAILSFACDTCGVELGTSQETIANYPNGSIETWNFADLQIYTYRDLVGYMASYLACFAFIGVDGKLYLKPYGTEPDRTVSEDWRFDYKPKDYEAYYTSLSAYFAVTEEYEDVVLSTYGLDYDLGANPFIQFNADDIRRAVLTNIITKLSEISYTPFTAKLPCDPSLMVGDVLNFTGNHAMDGKLACITKQVIRINGKMDVSCGGDDPNLNVLTATEKKIQTASRNSKKDGMYYYDYVNAEEITIGDGRTASVILFNYTTTKETHVDFHAEIKARVETTETYDEATDTYTEHDGVLYVTYRSGGDEVTDYYPVDSDFDGTKLFHLLYTWWASGNIISSFEVLIRCEGCSIIIEQGASRGYLAGVGLVGDVAWDGGVYVYDELEPIDFGRIRKQFESSVETVLAAPEDGSVTQALGRRNFMRTILKGFTETLGAKALHRFSVPYNDNEVAKVNIVTSGSVWQNEIVYSEDSAIYLEGTVTTPEKQVDRILQVTSHRTPGSGDVTYLASFDGGETWYSYAAGWSPYESGYGMTASVMADIPETDWAAMTVNHTIMIRAILQGNATLTDIQIYTEVYQ